MGNRFLFLYIIFTPIYLVAQVPSSKMDYMEGGNRILDFKITYTYQYVEGDMAQRFGNLNHVGGGIVYKTKKNWAAELELGYQFGNEVKEPGLLYFLTNSSGVVMNSGGYPANYTLGERGFNFTVKMGKVFALSDYNRNSGIMVMVGAGYYMHKINIQNKANDIPMLTEDLKKGYDRLSGGFGLTEFIGYMFHSQNRFINFYIGFDFVQSFTKSIRGYNYDQMQFDTKKRMDVTNGLRVGWLIPVYLNAADEDEFDFK